MIAMALFYDLISLALPTLIGLVAAINFWFWFKLHGISFMTPKRLAAGSTSLLLELFPFTSWIPSITAAVIFTIFDTRIKKAAGI